MAYSDDIQAWSQLGSAATSEQQAAVFLAQKQMAAQQAAPSTAVSQQQAAELQKAGYNQSSGNVQPGQAAGFITQIEQQKAAATANLESARSAYYSVANSGKSWSDEQYVNARQRYNLAEASYQQTMKDSITQYNAVSGAVPTSSGGGGEATGKSKTFGDNPSPYTRNALPGDIPAKQASGSPVDTGYSGGTFNPRTGETTGGRPSEFAMAQDRAAAGIRIAGGNVSGPNAGEFTTMSLPYVSSLAQARANPGAIVTEVAIQKGMARPNFYNPSDLGDAATQRMIDGEMASQGLWGADAPFVMRQNAGAASALEKQLQLAYATPVTRDDLYFANELRKASLNPGELSSSYHHLGMSMGVPIPANPFEYQGDIGVQLVAGTPTTDKQVFSPVSMLAASYLPNGLGISDYQWETAKLGPGQQILTPNFRPAVDFFAQATGQYGPYGNLFGGPNYQGTPSSEGLRKQADFSLSNMDLTNLGKYAMPGIGAGVSQSVTPERTAIVTGPVVGQFTPMVLPATQGSSGAMERLVGGGKVASVATATPIESIAGLPAPFVSRLNTQISNEYEPSGLFGLGGLLPSFGTPEQQKAYATSVKSNPLSFPIDMLGAGVERSYSAGAGALNAIVSGVTFGLIPTTFETTPISIRGTPLQYSESSVTSVSGGSPELIALGKEIDTSRGNLDRYNQTAVSEFNSKVDRYNLLSAQNPVVERTITTRSELQGTGTQDKIYASEWDRFVEGSGRVSRSLLGFNEAQYEAYGKTIENKPDAEGIAQRTVYEVGGVVANRPASLAPDVLAGGAFVLGGSLIGSGIAGVAAGASRVAPIAQAIMSPTGQLAAKAGSASFFGTLYTLNVTEGLTASPQRVERNVERSILPLAAMYAGGGGFNELPRVGLEGLRVVERVLPDISQRSVPGQPVVVAGPQFAVTNIKGLREFETPRDISGSTRLESGKMSETTPEPTQSYRPQYNVGDFTPLPSAKGVSAPGIPEPIGSVKLRTNAPSVALEITAAPVVKKVYIAGETSVRTGIGEFTPMPGIFPAKITNPALPEVFRGKVEQVSAPRGPSTPSIEIGRSPQVSVSIMKPLEAVPEINLGQATLIAQRGNARMIDTLTTAQLRTAKASGESKTQLSIGMKNAQRTEGLRSAKQTAFQMGTQRQIPNAEGLVDTQFGSTANTVQRSAISMRDAYTRAYPNIESTVIQGISIGSMDAALRASYPTMDTAVRQGITSEMAQTTKTHLASMEEAKTSLKIPQDTISPTPTPKAEREKYTPTTKPETIKEKFTPLTTITEIPREKFTPLTTITEIPREKFTPKDTITERERLKDTITGKETIYDRYTGRTPPIDPKVPLVSLPFGGLPGGGGGGGGFRTRKKRKVELFSFEMGEDTPIPTRYGLGGKTVMYIPGSRGIAADILPQGDIAPNRLFDIGNARKSGDRL